MSNWRVWLIPYQLMASAFSDSFMTSEAGGRGCWQHIFLRSWKVQKIWLWNFHLMLVSVIRNEVKMMMNRTWSANYRTKFGKHSFLELQLLDMLSSHAIFAGSSIFLLEIDPQSSRSISSRLPILMTNL